MTLLAIPGDPGAGIAQVASRGTQPRRPASWSLTNSLESGSIRTLGICRYGIESTQNTAVHQGLWTTALNVLIRKRYLAVSFP